MSEGEGVCLRASNEVDLSRRWSKKRRSLFSICDFASVRMYNERKRAFDGKTERA
jgi:hypothetical protein